MSISRRTIRGFTLLELMVVIAIISILASLSVPTFKRQIAKAKLIEAQNLATQHQSLVEEFILLQGSFPTESDFNPLKQTLSDESIVKSITVSDQNKGAGNLVLTLNSSTGISENQYLKYTRDTDRIWTCHSDLDANILPLQCGSQAEEDE